MGNRKVELNCLVTASAAESRAGEPTLRFAELTLRRECWYKALSPEGAAGRRFLMIRMRTLAQNEPRSRTRVLPPRLGILGQIARL